MNRTELIAAMAEKSGLNKKQSEAALKAFVDVVEEGLKNGDKISLLGFGTFEVKENPERDCRNLKTGETIHVGPSKSPKFKAGKALKDAVKGE